MTTTSSAGLAVGRWIVDVAHSTATFRVGKFGRTVTGTVPIIKGRVDIGPDGLPSAITGSLDLAPSTPGTPAGTQTFASRSFSISATRRP